MPRNPYTSFSSHLRPAAEEPPPPEPLPPEARVLANTISILAAITGNLASLQAEVLAHLPDAARLKLARTLNTAALSADSALSVFRHYQETGRLAAESAHRGGRRRPKAKP